MTELWLLFPILAQIKPSMVVRFDKRNFPIAATTLQFFLARNWVVYGSKVLKPNEAIEMMTFCEALYSAIAALEQTARDVIRYPNVQSGAEFVGRKVHPIVVVAHGRGNQGCFASLNMTAPCRR